MSDAPLLELFHQIAHSGSAQVRRYVVEHQLEPRLRFRNLAYDEVAAALKAYGGGGELPALWDGVRLFEGTEAVLERLKSL